LENIKNVIKMNGRVILNGQVGSGKKLVAISAAIIYRPEWPLLIICPGVKILKWRDEFLKWIPRLNFKSKL